MAFAAKIMPFEFINNLLIDRGARKKICSHMMKDEKFWEDMTPRKESLKNKCQDQIADVDKRVELKVQTA
jgi:hypothetical protein